MICPSFTFFATAGCISRTGARPVFVDVLEASFNCDPEDIERKITSRTKAIIPVHLYGRCADMDPILELAERHGIHVIEDAAQAIGAEYNGRRAGSMGEMGCFSFFPTKNLRKDPRPACPWRRAQISPRRHRRKLPARRPAGCADPAASSPSRCIIPATRGECRRLHEPPGGCGADLGPQPSASIAGGLASEAHLQSIHAALRRRNDPRGPA